MREGRRIYDNIRKFIKYVMTSNSAEIWTIFLAPFLGLPIPLLPIHILWINLVTDGLPGLALAVEPAEPDVMQRPPRPPEESIFAHGMWQHIVWVGLLMGGVSLLTQAWAMHARLGALADHGVHRAHAVADGARAGDPLGARVAVPHRLRCRTAPLLVAVALTFLLQLATLYVPALNAVFKTQPLSAGELGLCLALSSVVFFGVEFEKWLRRRGMIYRDHAAA